MKAAQVLSSIAPRIVILSPSSWVARPNAPQQDVAVGLRCLSSQELITVRVEATKEARRSNRPLELFSQLYGEELLAWSLGMAMCDPNNVMQPYFQLAEEDVRQQLTPQAMLHLWNELELLHLESSPLRPEATDEDLAELALTLTDPQAWERKGEGDAARLKRILRFCLEQLAPVEGKE